MRLRINSLELLGANRTYEFGPGLNIITGPIATGKTTLLRCIRGVLGSGLSNFPREARETISHLGASILIGDVEFRVLRPFVTTTTAKVEIAGGGEALRISALRPDVVSEDTYGKWLMRRIGLPVLEVPSTPTRADSDLSPVSINDYMMYSYLRQDEIDNSVFGHVNHYKNVKRKYVFDITYGRYDVVIAHIQEELRDTVRELSRLRSRISTIEEFLEDTPFENRAKISLQLSQLRNELDEIDQLSEVRAREIIKTAGAGDVREVIRELEEEISRKKDALANEERSVDQFEELHNQLITQSRRLTRSIVAGEYILDFDFVVCPRCGSSTNTSRVKAGECYLCMQSPKESIDREDLITEQDRLEKQIIETRELISAHQATIISLRNEVSEIGEQRGELGAKLDYLTNSYVSDSASELTSLARKRTELSERIDRLKEYLLLFDRLEASTTDIAKLSTRRDELAAEIDSLLSSQGVADERISYLETKFREIIGSFAPPEFVESGYTGIDPNTYLPLFEGRRFDELQSQGLKVIVNVAHTLAHHLTFLKYELHMPNIVLIDGITANIGHEGLDQERINSIFDYLVQIDKEFGDVLQILVAENTIPAHANKYIKVSLSEEDKLIPVSLLTEH